jgi:dienelactone hydrolase
MVLTLSFKMIETDSTFSLPARRRAEDILIAAKATYHIQVFSGVAHGFAVRGDPENENDRMYSRCFPLYD